MNIFDARSEANFKRRRPHGKNESSHDPRAFHRQRAIEGPRKLCAAFIRALASLALLATWQVAAKAQDRVVMYFTEINLAPNGDMEVMETIDIYLSVYAGRGFYRVLAPGDLIGHPARNPFQHEMISVTRNGSAHEFSSTALPAGGLNVLITDQDRSAGMRRYQIKYRAKGYIEFGPEFDGLHWSVLGTGWFVPVEKAQLRVNFPNPTKFSRAESWGKLKVAGYNEKTILLQSENSEQPNGQINVRISIVRGSLRNETRETCSEHLISTLKIPAPITKRLFHVLGSPTDFSDFVCDAQKKGFAVGYSSPGWFTDLHKMTIGDVELWFAPIATTATGSITKISAEDPQARLAIFSVRFRGKSEEAIQNWIRLGTFTEAILNLVLFQKMMPH